MFERVLLDRIRSWTADRTEDQRTGERLFEQGDYAGAELHLVKAMVEDERRKQSSDKRILLRLELAESQRKQFRHGAGNSAGDKLGEAEENIRSAMDLAKRTGERGLTLQCLDALALVLGDREDLTQMEQVVREATDLEAKLKRCDPMAAARRMNRLGFLRQKHGKLEEAAAALTESATIHEQVLGANHIGTANRMSELAAVYHALEKHTDTQRCLRRAIRVHEAECGLDSPEAVSDLQMLTESLEVSGDLDSAAAQFERVLGLKLRLVGADLDDIAEAQVRLANRYIDWRRYSRARELLLEAVGSFKRKGGPRLALGYETLARIAEETGHYHDAISEWNRAGKVWESLQPAHTVELIRNLEYRAFLLEQLRQDRDAAYLREKATALQEAIRWAAAV
jgi:tetratricopeptide repeat protein